MTTPLPPGWESDVLGGLSDPITPANIQTLDAWQAAEGGSTNDPDAYNPLNTTRNTDLAGRPLGGFPTNSVGVLSFPSWPAGDAATVATIEQANMSGIQSALRASSPPAVTEKAITSSPWGTKTIGSVSGSSSSSSSSSSGGGLLSFLDPAAIGTSIVSGLTGSFLPLLARIFLYVAFVAGGIVLVVLGLQRLTGAHGVPIPIPIPA